MCIECSFVTEHHYKMYDIVLADKYHSLILSFYSSCIYLLTLN